ncbi:MAG: HNH endonuclease [Actinomycetota bacterium]|nr:HNH endonuclease [Actinomycetota bacterium]
MNSEYRLRAGEEVVPVKYGGGSRSRERLAMLVALRTEAGAGPESDLAGGDSVDSMRTIERWRAGMLDLPPLHFIELAAMLRDRPRPVETMAVAGSNPSGSSPNSSNSSDSNQSGPTPVWARALLDSLVANQRLIAHFQARFAADLAELAGSYPGLREHLATEIAINLGISEGSANRQLDEAAEVAGRLPATASAHWQGLLTGWKVTAIRTETADVDDVVAAAVEGDVLPDAPRQTVPELRAAIRRSILIRDAKGAEDRHCNAVAKRKVTRFDLPDGMAGLQVTSSAPEIAAIWDTIAAVAGLAKTAGDDRIGDQRRADALVDICTDILESGRFAGSELPQAHRRRPQIQVTMPLDALLGSASPCELRGYGPITADQARRIAADGQLRRLVCDPLSGALLDLGRTRYEPSRELADFVLSRDVICTAPGCRQPSRRCETDHTVPYSAGGSTAAANLSALCKHHHRAKDGGGFTVRRQPDGSAIWTTPLGTSVRTPPPRLWHPPDGAGPPGGTRIE